MLFGFLQIKDSEPPLSLYGQLLWREFFYTAATRNPNFDRMLGNPICIQVKICSWPKLNWAQPLYDKFFSCQSLTQFFIPPTHQIPWDTNPEALAKWASGQTGFPWIDAIMTQLREEGWIHHFARHAVACFLTRGHLWISWEEGMKVKHLNKAVLQ